MTWGKAIFWFSIGMVALDIFYLIPNYALSLTNEPTMTEYAPLPFVVFASWLKFVFGIPLIFIGVATENFIFTSGWFGTASSSALVMYVLFIPYLIALSFLIEGRSGVPPAYRLFQFFIARSGAQYVDQESFDPRAFKRDTEDERHDRYQARMEEEELRAAAERARAAADKMNERSARRMEAEAARVRAAEDAAKAAEEKFRAKARERASRKR